MTTVTYGLDREPIGFQLGCLGFAPPHGLDSGEATYTLTAYGTHKVFAPPGNLMKIEQLSRPDWESYLAARDDWPPGASPGVVEALASVWPGARWGACLVDRGPSGMLIPFVRHASKVGPQVHSLPFGVLCGPVSPTGTCAPVPAGRLRREFRAVRYIASIHPMHAGSYQNCLGETHMLSLSASSPVEAAYRSRVRRHLAKSAKGGAEISFTLGRDISTLVDLLQTTARDDQRPVYPARVINAALLSGQSVGILAAWRGKPVAGGLFLHSPAETMYWLGGSTKEGRELQASYAVIDAGLKWAARRGCLRFNFGSSIGLPGVAHFKEGFGALPVGYPILHSRLPHVAMTDRARRARSLGVLAFGGEESRLSLNR